MRPRTLQPSSALPEIDALSPPSMGWRPRWSCSQRWGGSRRSAYLAAVGSTVPQEHSYRFDLKMTTAHNRENIKKGLRLRRMAGITIVTLVICLQNENDLSSLDCPKGKYCPTPALRLPCPAGSYCIERTTNPITCDYNYLLTNSPYTSE